MADNIRRVSDAADPRRCQALSKGQTQQCDMEAVENGTYCMMHGGNKQLEAQKKASLKNYQLDMWRARLQRHSSSSNIKSLRDEIGILRMMLEVRLNQCKDDMDLMLHSAPIADLVMKVDKVVTSCHKLEGSLGELLDKTAILQFANEMITLISDILKDDPEKIELIGQGIMSIVGRLGADEPETEGDVA